MKEATGDLNMSVVVVILVAAMVAFFSMVIAPLVVGGIKSETNCADAICPCVDKNAKGTVCEDCHLKGKATRFSCPYKG